jgi:DNA-binding MarR family transcriptional regulator
MQAIGLDGATASELGRRLGISKQAAGKTAERLEALGYVRAKAMTPTAAAS